MLFYVNIFMTFGIIFLERKSPKSTYAWLLFLWIIPILGFLFYLFLSQNFTRHKIYKYNTPEDVEYHKLMNSRHLIRSSPEASDNNIMQDHYRRTIEYHYNACDAFYSNNNHVSIYTDGKDKFEALFSAIEKATSSIHLEYYIIKNDDLGKAFMELLIKKAREGVEVRFLYDEMGGRYIPRRTLKSLEAVGGQYGAFFPTKLRLVNLRVNYRDHRKITVIDGKTAFIGGFNIGDEYLGLNKKMGYWRSQEKNGLLAGYSP